MTVGAKSRPKGAEAFPEAGPCRWCGGACRLLGGRFVHTASDEGYCPDGRHVAELAPTAAAPTPKAKCSLCGSWYEIPDAADHWRQCPGPKVDATGKRVPT